MSAKASIYTKTYAEKSEIQRYCKLLIALVDAREPFAQIDRPYRMVALSQYLYVTKALRMKPRPSEGKPPLAPPKHGLRKTKLNRNQTAKKLSLRWAQLD